LKLGKERKLISQSSRSKWVQTNKSVAFAFGIVCRVLISTLIILASLHIQVRPWNMELGLIWLLIGVIRLL